jgi:hypothetical protein
MTELQTVCAKRTWSTDEEVELGPLQEEGMIGLNPIPYVEQDDTFSVLMAMEGNSIEP